MKMIIRRFLVSLLEVVEVALVALVAVFLIRHFLIQPFLVSGNSMVPNFAHGDYLLIDEITYRFREPVRGEVAVFHYPQNEATFFIKRIIGLPGERVRLTNNRLTVSGGSSGEELILEEPYLASGTMTSGEIDTTLGENEFFVLGDNRAFSFDSRSWGVLKREEIVGVVRLRLWPLGALQVFAAPSYQ